MDKNKNDYYCVMVSWIIVVLDGLFDECCLAFVSLVQKILGCKNMVFDMIEIKHLIIVIGLTVFAGRG